MLIVFSFVSCDNEKESPKENVSNAIFGENALYANDFSDPRTQEDFCPEVDNSNPGVHENYTGSFVINNGVAEVYRNSAWFAKDGLALGNNTYKLSYDVKLNMAGLEEGSRVAFDAGVFNCWLNSWGMRVVKTENGAKVGAKWNSTNFILDVQDDDLIHVEVVISPAETVGEVVGTTTFTVGETTVEAEKDIKTFNNSDKVLWCVYEVSGNGENPIAFVDNFIFEDITE